MLLQLVTVCLILGTGVLYSIRTGKMDDAGALTGGLLGILIFLGAGFTGLMMLACFFLAGSAVTSWKLNYKINQGLAEKNKGRRTAGQALANAGVAGILGLISWLYPGEEEVCRLMLAASLAAATSDTFASELGNIYGRRYVNILTLKPDTKGLNGVISWEGTLFGVAGSTLISFIYTIGFGWGWEVTWIILAGVIGNLSDSILGATLERKNVLTNNAVNFLNTLIGALMAAFFYIWWN